MGKSKIYRSLVILAVTLAFILVVTMALQFVMIGVESAKTKKLTAELDSLNTNIQNIQDDVEYRKTMMYIEKYAREQLNLYGEGDVIFVPKN
ncbi:MAG: septum formation initiator family protein [Clostridia bacterium]